MPYIKKDDRQKFYGPGMLSLEMDAATNAGELNYAVTQLIMAYFELNGRRYQQINDIIGALEGAKMEFYRRVVAPYEQEKMKENGDVYL